MTDVRDEAASAAATEPRGNPAGDFIWYELMTPDPAGSKAFYDAVVGWDIDAQSVMPGGMDYRMIKRSDGGNAGGMLALTDDMRQHGARPTWLGYLNVEDVDATVARVEQKGGTLLMPASDIEGVGRIAMVADPQGAPFYVMTPTPPAGDPDAKSDVFSQDRPQRVNWNELSTSDEPAARTFYADLFGWSSDESMDMGENGQYRFIDHGGQRIGAMFRSMDGGQPHWRFYVGVPSIARAIEAVKAAGVTVKMGPHEVPGGSHIIVGEDPQGAEFALVGGQ